MAEAFEFVQLPLGPTATNCYLAADPATRDAAVIDPGWEAPRILAELEQRGWVCRAVWLTHAHFDHLGAVSEVMAATGAPLALHPSDLPLLRVQGGARLFGFSLPPLPEPNLLLSPGAPVTAGSLTLDVLFVPGHTPGHVAFLHRAAGVVFSGDVLFAQGIGRTDLPGGDYATLLASIHDQLLPLPDETTVCSGHGPLTTIGTERRENPFLAD
jgi:glyoxylase-like metal-dependent hydrolase (beta-lactamase superfamily II)